MSVCALARLHRILAEGSRNTHGGTYLGNWGLGKTSFKWGVTRAQSIDGEEEEKDGRK